MARFIQPQQQQIVSMYEPKNIEFYSNILNKAQSDLERATAIKSAALEKYGDLTAYTQEDRDLTWGAANKDLANVLDADFVSPSRVASAVMETNKKVMPYVQALKAKDKEAQLQRQLRAQWGTDFIGNDVANMAIADAYGQAVDPSSIRGINYNAEQFRKMFHESYGANLLNKIESELKSSGRAGILTRETVKGLTKQAKYDLLSPGSPEAIRLASQNFTSLPEDTQKDLAAIYGGVEGAINYLQQENYKTAFDPRYNFESSFQDITDPSFNRTSTSTESTSSGWIFTPVPNPVAMPSKPPTFSLRSAINQHTFATTNAGSLEVLNKLPELTVRYLGRGQFDSTTISRAVSDKNNPNRNQLITTAIVINPDLKDKFVVDNFGNYQYKDMRNSSKLDQEIGSTLWKAKNSKGNYTANTEKALLQERENFMKEYSPMYDALKQAGFDDTTILDKIDSWETSANVTKSFNLNNEAAGEKLINYVISSYGEAAKVKEVDSKTGQYGKDKSAREVLSKDKAGILRNVKVNPSTNAIEATYDKGGEVVTYAIEAKEGAFGSVGTEAMETLSEFTKSLQSAKSPETLIYSKYDNNNIGYQIIRDLGNGNNYIFKVKLDDNRNIVARTSNPVPQEDVIQHYLEQLLGDTSVENQPVKQKIQ